MSLKNLLVLCGGRSAEHEVSLQSALNIVAAVDRTRYRVIVVGIDRQGDWRRLEPDCFVQHAADPARICLKEGGEPVALACRNGSAWLVALAHAECTPVDVAFPVLHGPFGEDGTMQGLLAMVNLPFVGCDHAASATCMDKTITKQLLKDAGIAVAPALAATRHGTVTGKQVARHLGWPVFVKPACLGSSVGISKVYGPDDLEAALQTAFRYDECVLIEAFMPGREIECAVLGNDKPRAAVPGEIVPTHDFYSYDAKYLDEKGARLEAPAALPHDISQQVRQTAVRAFEALKCSGMARVDFFLDEHGALTVNEINTIPGFTRISMYPRLWQLSGLSYPELVSELIRLGLERHQESSERSSDFHAG